MFARPPQLATSFNRRLKIYSLCASTLVLCCHRTAGDAGVTTAHVDNHPILASQIWAPNGPQLTHLEAPADSNAICFRIHNLALQ